MVRCHNLCDRACADVCCPAQPTGQLPGPERPENEHGRPGQEDHHRHTRSGEAPSRPQTPFRRSRGDGHSCQKQEASPRNQSIEGYTRVARTDHVRRADRRGVAKRSCWPPTKNAGRPLRPRRKQGSVRPDGCFGGRTRQPGPFDSSPRGGLPSQGDGSKRCLAAAGRQNGIVTVPSRGLRPRTLAYLAMERSGERRRDSTITGRERTAYVREVADQNILLAWRHVLRTAGRRELEGRGAVARRPRCSSSGGFSSDISSTIAGIHAGTASVSSRKRIATEGSDHLRSSCTNATREALKT